MGPDLDTHFVQYMANAGRRKLNLYQRMGLVESGACRELKMQILNNRCKLDEAFAEADPENTGKINLSLIIFVFISIFQDTYLLLNGV